VEIKEVNTEEKRIQDAETGQLWTKTVYKDTTSNCKEVFNPTGKQEDVLFRERKKSAF